MASRLTAAGPFTGPVVTSDHFDIGDVGPDEVIGCIGTDRAMLDAVSALIAGRRRVRVFEDRPIDILPGGRALPLRRAELLSTAGHCVGTAGRLVALAPGTGPIRSRLVSARRHLERRSASALRSREVSDGWTRRQLTPGRFEQRRRLRHDRYLRAIASPECTLVSWPIASITATGVRTCDGIEHRLDRIVTVAEPARQTITASTASTGSMSAASSRVPSSIRPNRMAR